MKSRKKILVSLLVGLSTLTMALALGYCDMFEQPHTHTWDEMQVTKAPTCTEKGEIVCVCTDCEETTIMTISALGHSYLVDEENSIEPTCETDGKTVEICERDACGAVLETQLPAMGHKLVDGECVCGKSDKKESVGLKYTLLDNDTCEVSGIDECTDTDIVIPATYKEKTVITIGHRAFEDCTNLTSVEIPDSVLAIGENAFRGCTSLKSVKIGDSVVGIDKNAFYNCSSLTNVVIGDSVKIILDNAFYNCSSLTSVKIPKSVTEIYGGAFAGCTSLTSIKVSEENTVYKDIDGSIYSKDGKFLIQYAIGKTATEFIIPNSVTSIGDYAFRGCSSLTSVVIPDSVTSIGDNAFYNCDSLTSVVIGNSVTSIGSSAFDGFTSLTNVYYKGTESEWNEISIGSYNPKLTDATRYYYSEKRATGCWRYVNGVPTAW